MKLKIKKYKNFICKIIDNFLALFIIFFDIFSFLRASTLSSDKAKISIIHYSLFSSSKVEFSKYKENILSYMGISNVNKTLPKKNEITEEYII